MPTAHPLDRPFWAAMTGRQRPLTVRHGRALRFRPEYTPFAGAEDDSPGSLADLAALDPGEAGLWLAELAKAKVPPGMVATMSAAGVQMISQAIAGGGREVDWAELTEADAPQMLALALLTRPGPFSTRTHQMGAFVGVKLDGRLVAMAGERLKPDGFTEVSGVCTHPDYRGRGYAGALMRIVAERILGRGETAYLHAYATNAGAIALYETLGFRHRQDVVFTVLKRA